MTLNDEQLKRYDRNIVITEMGQAGQEKLLASKVLVIGAGGLGSPAALYLAAAGVGTIGLLDSDKADLTNLQRQILHHTSDIGRDKTKSASVKLNALNPDIKINCYQERATASNLPQILSDYDFVIDCTDNFDAKFLINDVAHFCGKPFSHAGVLRFGGQMMTVIPKKSACFRCVFNYPPEPGVAPVPSEVGILGAVAGTIGTMQATEAIKYVTGIGQPLTNTLLTYDALEMNFRRIKIKPNPRCPLCSDNPVIAGL